MVAVYEAGPAEGAAAEACFQRDPGNVGHLVDGAHNITVHHLKDPLAANPTLSLVANKTLEVGEKLLVLFRTTGESFQLKKLVLEIWAEFPSLTIPTKATISLKPLSCHQAKKKGKKKKGEHHTRAPQADAN